jgi:hypothetical protein
VGIKQAKRADEKEQFHAEITGGLNELQVVALGHSRDGNHPKRQLPVVKQHHQYDGDPESEAVHER